MTTTLVLSKLSCQNPNQHRTIGMYSLGDPHGIGYTVNGCGGPYYDQGAVRLSSLPARHREVVRRRLDELVADKSITGEELDDFYRRDGLPEVQP